MRYIINQPDCDSVFKENSHIDSSDDSTREYHGNEGGTKKEIERYELQATNIK
jgi:hypothetical protein